MLPEMEGSLAASSRPSTSYAVQKPVPSQRHRLAPEQLRSTSSAVSILIVVSTKFHCKKKPAVVLAETSSY